MNRVVIQEGYSMPVFDGVRRKRRSSKRRTGHASRFGRCAKQGRGKSAAQFRAHMKRCLSK